MSSRSFFNWSRNACWFCRNSLNALGSPRWPCCLADPVVLAGPLSLLPLLSLLAALLAVLTLLAALPALLILALAERLVPQLLLFLDHLAEFVEHLRHFIVAVLALLLAAIRRFCIICDS